MKKLALILCLVLTLSLLLAACAKAPAQEDTAAPAQSTEAPVESTEAPVETTEAPVETTEAPAEGESAYILYNGTKIAPGVKYADIQEGLGKESAPAQVILPCDGSDAYRDTMHTFPGMAVTENIDGVISNVELSDLYEGQGDAALMGVITLGSTLEETVEVLGEPENFPLAEDDYGLTYPFDGMRLLVFLDPDNKDIVSGVSMFLEQP